jgi:hypothetical protein
LSVGFQYGINPPLVSTWITATEEIEYVRADPKIDAHLRLRRSLDFLPGNGVGDFRHGTNTRTRFTTVAQR